MKNIYKLLVLFAIAIFYCCCTKSYQPVVTTVDYNYLVVEGTVNVAPDSTMIKLSRSVKLSDGTNTRPELKALVTVEDQSGRSFVLTERNNGYYFASALSLINTQNYRLKIITADNKTYLSDYVPVKVSPPIDSIGYTIKAGGIDIYCNTHDPANNTHYYRWDFQETWEYAPPFISPLISDGLKLITKPPSQLITHCWRNSTSGNVIIGTSTQLTQDVIYQGLLTFIPASSEKIGMKYSMLLRQYPLTKEGYQFWQNIKTNTENLGSIFDAQPSVLKGNIHNVSDPNEPVIGFLSVVAIGSKRVFINRSGFPASWIASVPPVAGCMLDTAFFNNAMTHFNDVSSSLIQRPSPYAALREAYVGAVFVGYLRAPAPCTDCTINGGSSKQPSFWQ